MLRDHYKEMLHMYADCAERLKKARKEYELAVKECNELMPHLHKEMPPRKMNYNELRKIHAKVCKEKKDFLRNCQRMYEIYYKELLEFHFGA